MAVSLEQFIQQLEQSGILSPDVLQEFLPPESSPESVEALHRETRVLVLADGPEYVMQG